MSRHCRDIFVVPVDFIKLPHAEQVGACKTTQARLGLGQVRGKLWDDAVSPLSACDLAADDGTNLPVKLDKLAVHRLDRALAGSGNQLDDFTESGVGDGVLAHVWQFLALVELCRRLRQNCWSLSFGQTLDHGQDAVGDALQLGVDFSQAGAVA
jgi:hypothetical protein